MIDRDIFDELFVLEMANNHWGRVERGLKIVNTFGQVVRFNNIRAAIKLQFRDVDSFVHKDYVHRTDIRYIKKTLDTRMSKDDFATLVKAVRKASCMPFATPFDETSVDLCCELAIPILKIASSDLNDWLLLEKIAKTKKPVIVSTGGSSIKDLDDLVTFFHNRSIPMAINHCVSIYPSEDRELELNQIDYLRARYPSLTVGFSTHEHTDWSSSMLIAYAKGARTFERHIDIEADGIPVSPYCSKPEQADAWFKAFHKAKEMCGAPGTQKRMPPSKEIQYLDSLVRGVYARRDLPEGHVLSDEDVYLAVPLLRGQISCRELMSGEVLLHGLSKDEAIMIDDIDSPYASIPSLRERIYSRGLDTGKRVVQLPANFIEGPPIVARATGEAPMRTIAGYRDKTATTHIREEAI